MSLRCFDDSCAASWVLPPAAGVANWQSSAVCLQHPPHGGCSGRGRKGQARNSPLAPVAGAGVLGSSQAASPKEVQVPELQPPCKAKKSLQDGRAVAQWGSICWACWGPKLNAGHRQPVMCQGLGGEGTLSWGQAVRAGSVPECWANSVSSAGSLDGEASSTCRWNAR